MEKYLTPEGLEKLKKELNYLKTEKRKEIAQRLKRTASFGDLSENAGYDEAKDAQGFLEGRISELKKIIATAKVSDRKNGDSIQVGSRVTAESKNGKLEIEIVGEAESDPLKGKVSCESPLGRAFFGKEKGDSVEVETPEGKTRYKILKIE